jgi:hypothetical protein
MVGYYQADVEHIHGRYAQACGSEQDFAAYLREHGTPIRTLEHV